MPSTAGRDIPNSPPPKQSPWWSQNENTAVFFEFVMGGGTVTQPESDEERQKLLRFLVANDDMKVQVSMITPTKPYSD